MLQSDCAQVQRLVEAAVRQLSGPAAPSSATPLDNCQLMEAMNDCHISQLLPRLRGCDEEVATFCQRCMDSKVSVRVAETLSLPLASPLHTHRQPAGCPAGWLGAQELHLAQASALHPCHSTLCHNVMAQKKQGMHASKWVTMNDAGMNEGSVSSLSRCAFPRIFGRCWGAKA